jgi:lysozyme
MELNMNRFPLTHSLNISILAAILLAVAFPSYGGDPDGTSAAELGLIELTDDLSRQDLFAEIRNAYAASDPTGAKESTQFFDLYGPFRFPNDVVFDYTLNKPREDSLFGVDISHHTDLKFPIEQLPARKVKFLYMKATQGAKFLDRSFAGFWARAKPIKVHRGAYHFLSSTNPLVVQEKWNDEEASDWGKAQAAIFIKVVKANGGLLPTDMPPVVDLEWDKASKDGPDRWKNRPPSQVISMVNGFLSEVKDQLKRNPIIYTAQSWWREQMKSDAHITALSSYPIWLADYSKKSRASEVPRTINNTRWVLWQFTDASEMAMGFNGAFDANIFKGKTEDFYASLGIVEFK